MWRTLGIFASICVISEIVYQFYKYRFTRSVRGKEKNTEVLFFPDKKVACIKHFTSECDSESCSYSHEENSLSKLFRYLHEAVHSLDVCVFVITCTDLADLLIQAAERGVCVRVITDCEQVDIPGSQIWKLRSQGMYSIYKRPKFDMVCLTRDINNYHVMRLSLFMNSGLLFLGIAVRTDDSSFFMHHKFVIIDNKKLLNGSFNWTRQAITGNQENLLVTSEPKVLHKYEERFSFLWHLYNPKKEQ